MTGGNAQTGAAAVGKPQKLRTSRGASLADLGSAEEAISEQLLQARRAAKALAGFPGTAPSDLATAYDLQARSISHWPDNIAGWKVGGIPTAWREKLGAEWLVGPIFTKSVKSYGGTEIVAMPVFEGGFAAIEPEFVIRLGETRAEDTMFISAEIASSPVPAINDYGPSAVICDFGNNNGLLVGNEIANWRAFESSIEVSIWIDDKLIGSRVLDDLSAGAVSARDFCLAHAEQRGQPLSAGTLISTGAITGVHEAKLGARSRISFGDFGNLELELVPAKPVST